MTAAVLSIQSSVAFGHVGNSAATFPLQCLGFEVWPVPTVILSNHKGYQCWQGRDVSPDDVRDLVEGVGAVSGFRGVQALLSGYLGTENMGAVVLEALDQVRKAEPDLLYLCDPVMGDEDRGFFVGDTIPPFFKDEALPKADIITPNQFELGWLTSTTIRTLKDALDASKGLLEFGPKIVVVTSIEVCDYPSMLGTLAVSADESWIVWSKKLPVSLSGTGDTFAALMLGHYLRTRSIKTALEMAASAMLELIGMTVANRSGELCLIEARNSFEAPKTLLRASVGDQGCGLQ